MAETEFLTRQQTASRLGIGLRTLDRLIANQMIPSLKLGGKRLFVRERLNQWLESLETGVNND